MSPPVALGSVAQIAFVSQDIEDSIGFWTRSMRVGPFILIDHVEMTDVVFRGQSTGNLLVSIAIAYWGETQLEIIQQHNDVPSAYNSRRSASADDVHHFYCPVDDYQKARETCIVGGGTPVMDMVLKGAGRATYFEMKPGSPWLVEIGQADEKIVGQFQQLKEITSRWSGDDPIRRLPRSLFA